MFMVCELCLKLNYSSNNRDISLERMVFNEILSPKKQSVYYVDFSFGYLYD